MPPRLQCSGQTPLAQSKFGSVLFLIFKDVEVLIQMMAMARKEISRMSLQEDPYFVKKDDMITCGESLYSLLNI
jgi:hypothetical protein